MDEHGLSITQSQLSTLFNALGAIDQRLSRIESALRLPAFDQPATLSSTPIPVPVPVQHPNSNQLVLNQPHEPAVMAPMFMALEAPPQGYTVSSRATMQEELDNFTIPRGYSMRIAGAKVTGKKKVRWVCYRGGEARHHRGPVDESVIQQAKAEGRRKPTTDRSSKKCGCMFKFELIETTKGSDIWVLHYPNDEHKVHNHGPSDQTSDPRARKLPPFMSVEVDEWLRSGRQVSKIQEDLKARGFMNVLNTDLYNRKRMLSKHDSQTIGIL
jgi:hypothetical protein